MLTRIVSCVWVTVFVLTGIGPVFAEQPPLVSSVVAVDDPAMGEAWAMERALGAASIPMRDLQDLAVRFKRAPADAPRVALAARAPGVETLGSRRTFWVNDLADRSHSQRTATLRAVTPHLYLWVEDGYDVSDEGLLRSAERFETRIYPTARAAFGSEWDPGVDGDGHVHVFNGRVPGVGGYYSDTDEFTSAVNPYSNERELFYLNLDNATPGTDLYDGILAHEFQHMIHWNAKRLARRSEQTWVNEGLSELSAEINDLGNLSSYGAFLAQPNTQLTDWADAPNAAAAHYGAARSFMHYVLKRFGADVIRAWVVDADTGLAALDRILRRQGLGVSADQVFVDWTVANTLGNPAVGPAGRYAYRLGDLPPVPSASYDRYPVETDGQVRQYGAQYIDLKGAGDVEVEVRSASTVKLVPNEAHGGRYQWWSNRGDNGDMTLTRAFDLRGLKSASLSFWMWYDAEASWDYAYVAASTDGGRTWDTLRGAHNSDKNDNGNSLGWAYTGVSGGGETPTWVREQMDLTPYAGRTVWLRFEYVTDDAVNRAGFCVDDIQVPELHFTDDAETDAASWVARGFVRSSNRAPQRLVAQLIEFGAQIRVRALSEEPVAAPNRVAPVAAQRELLAAHFDGAAVRAGAKIAVPLTDAMRQELPSLRGQVEGSVAASTAGDAAASVAEPNADVAPGAPQRIVVRGLGRELTRAVLVISALAPVTTQPAAYHLSVQPAQP